MAQLLVNADDFGLHESVNEAIANCVNAGSVNSISVIANGAAPDFNLLRELKNKKVFIGAHITWVGEPWLTNSYVFNNWKALIAKVITGGSGFRKMMRQEAHAQINLLLNNGIQLSHIDSHQHVHLFPPIWKLTCEIQLQYQIKNTRVPKVVHISSLRKSLPGVVLNMLASQKHETGKHFYCAGIKYAGNYNLPLLKNELSSYSGMNTMLIVHPGASNQQLNKKYGHWHFNWETEYKTLMDPAFLKMVKDIGFELQ